MKICSPINSKTLAELLYTGQNRLILKATCKKKKKDNLLNIKNSNELVATSTVSIIRLSSHKGKSGSIEGGGGLIKCSSVQKI